MKRSSQLLALKREPLELTEIAKSTSSSVEIISVGLPWKSSKFARLEIIPKPSKEAVNESQ